MKRFVFTGVLVAMSSVSCAAASIAADFPKVAKASATRKASISPVAQPDGELRPPYSTQSLQVGGRGETVLEIFVNARGSIMDVAVLKSSGSSQLDTSAVENARANWKFLPAMRNGVAVPSRRIETIMWSSARRGE